MIQIFYYIVMFQPEIIQKSGYSVQEHKATTKDGYILTLFRIPKEGGQPVFLIHGVLCTSSNFVSLGKDSLGTPFFKNHPIHLLTHSIFHSFPAGGRGLRRVAGELQRERIFRGTCQSDCQG